MQVQTEKGDTFEFDEGTPPAEISQTIDAYYAKPAQDAVDVHKSLGRQVSDIAMEGMAAANRGAAMIFDLPPMLYNAVSELAGSDSRAMMASQLPGVRGGTQGNFMEEGAARDAVRIGGEFTGGSMFGSMGMFARSQNLARQPGQISQLGRSSLPTGAQAAGEQTKQGLLRRPTGDITRTTGSRSATESAMIDPSGVFKREAVTGGLFGTGAATGSVLSEGDPTAEFIGGMIAASRGAPVRFAVDTGRNIGSGVRQAFSKKAAKQRAFEFIRLHSKNPERAAKTLRKNLSEGKNGTLAQLSEDEGIAAIENRLISNSPTDIGPRVRISDEEFVDSILGTYEKAAGAGQAGQASEFMRARVNAGLGRVNAAVQRAKDAARSAMERAGTPLEPRDASRAIQDATDDAFTRVRELESEAWGNVPSDLKQTTKGIKERLRANMEGMTPTARRVVSPRVREEMGLIKQLGGEVHPQELADLRSTLSASLRRARDENAPSNVIHTLDEMQKGVLEALDSADTSSAYREAIAITKKKHELLNDGLFGKARRNATPEDLGEKVLRSGGVGGPMADELSQISQAYGTDLPGATGEMIRAAFGKAVVQADGTVNPRAAQQFLKRYQGMLSRFPKIAEELSSAEGAQRAAERVTQAGKNARRSIEKSRAALYSDFEDPQRAVQSIFSGSVKNQTEAISSLARTAARDPDGLALPGLKRDFIETLTDRMVTRTAKGVNINRGFEREWKKMQKPLEESGLFSPDEVQRLNGVVDDMRRYFIRQRVPAIKENVHEDVIAIGLGSIAGARIGAQFGTTPLIAAGLGRKFAQRVMQVMPRDRTMGLVEDMVMNPQHFDEFSRSAKDISNQGEFLNAFNTWLVKAGMQPLADEELQEMLQEETEMTVDSFTN